MEWTPQIVSFSVSGIFGGGLEGSREGVCARVRERLEKNYPTDKANSGCALLLPEASVFPRYRCEATVDGPDGDPRSDGFMRLKICWFVDDLERPIGELVEEAVSQVDWFERARICSYW